jgi:ABC-2 type transport system ATP-binding protein
MSITVKNTSKYYGKQKALNDVSFSIDTGEIVGFLGPNGAGKSTMMKIITAYIEANEGEVLVNGLDVQKDELAVKRSVGYLPEHNPMYPDMYIKEYLQFHANIHKVDKQRISEVIDQVGLGPEQHKKIGQLSKGYRQRVGLAAALLHDPQVLVLDEPTTGLDPNQLVGIREMIKEIGREKTILLSTHIMQEVEAMCNRVIIIKGGEIVADKNLKELMDRKEQVIEAEFDRPVENKLWHGLSGLTEAKNTEGNIWQLVFDTQNDMRPKIFDLAKNSGFRILSMQRKVVNLEELFRTLTN